MTRQCLKFSIVYLNLMLMLIGAAAVGLGIWVLANDEDFLEDTSDVLDLSILGDDLLKTCAMAMLTAGAVVFVLGTVGCVGAFSHSSTLMAFYSLCLIVVLAVEVAVLALVIVFRSEISDKIDEEVIESMKTKYGDPSQSFTKSFDSLQKELDCCGWESGTDYNDSAIKDGNVWNRTLANGTERVVPDACCQSSNDTVVYQCVIAPYTYNGTAYNSRGCKDEIEDKFEEYTWVIIGATAGLLGFQFLLISLSFCWVINNVGKKYHM